MPMHIGRLVAEITLELSNQTIDSITVLALKNNQANPVYTKAADHPPSLRTVCLPSSCRP